MEKQLLQSIVIVACIISTSASDTDHHNTPSDDISVLAVEAQQTLLNYKYSLGLGRIKGPMTPIFRLDLEKDYVAYWQLEFDDRHIIIRSSPRTGDREMPGDGPLPAPTTQMMKTAVSHHNATCHKFYMLSPGGEMMCTDQQERAVATNFPHTVFTGVNKTGLEENNLIDIMTTHIQSKLDEMKEEWGKHRERIGDAGGSGGGGEPSGNKEDAFNAAPIIPGHRHLLAIGDRTNIQMVLITNIPQHNHSQEAGQQLLCSVIKGCDEQSENPNLLSYSIQTDDELHVHYIELYIDKSAEETFRGEEFVFQVELIYKAGTKVVHYFSVLHEKGRQKRRTERQNWSAYTTKSIPREYDFPDYDQFTSGKCAVGCGPVAWAMIFGYFDRRDHRSSSFSGSEGLYRKGSDGATGSDSEIAPSRNDDRMKKYIEKLNDELGTFCLFDFGVTFMSLMKRAESFFKGRQTSGSPGIEEKRWSLTWLGRYRSTISEWTRDRVNHEWPVIVGWRTGLIAGWHYPVVTKYRTRTRKYRRCAWRWCGSWKTETEHDMYLHMGWGGRSNGWKTMEAFFAIAATY